MKVKHFESNTEGTDYVVGDIHGCLEDLLLAMKALNFNEEVDRMFSVGDLIDRGPNSFECGHLIYKSWFHAVQGNHEEFMWKGLLEHDSMMYRTWLQNGGEWIYKPHTFALAYSSEHLQSLAKGFKELPLVITVGEGDARFNIVHAEFALSNNPFTTMPKLINDQDIDQWTFTATDEDRMLWGRSLIRNTDPNDPHSHGEGLSPTYVGHTPTREILYCQKQMYIDTGCVYYHLGKTNRYHHALSIACPSRRIAYQWSPMWKKLSHVMYDDIHVHNGGTSIW